MKLKKILCVTAAAALCAGALTACGNDGKTSGSETFDVYMPDGAPAIAMSAMMHSGYYATDFKVVNASTITAHVSDGDADLAIMPINAAAALYNGGKKITMLSVNTHGNLYFVGAEAEGFTPADLVGKRVGVIGRAQVPDLTLRMLFDNLGIEYTESETAVPGKVALIYQNDGPSLFPLFKQKKIDVMFLAEPAATTAIGKLGTPDNKLAIIADAQALWRSQFGGEYPQACLVAQSDVVKKYPEYVGWFVSALKSTDGWAEAHPDLAVSAVKTAAKAGGITSTLPDTLAAGVIERCNIETTYAYDAKSACESYFGMLTEMVNELGKPVLAKAPDDGFYAQKSLFPIA